MHEFETYIASLMKSASENVANAPVTAPAANTVQAPVSTTLATPGTPVTTPTTVAGNQKMASAIQDAENQLASSNPALLKAADDLAFMEAYTATKQANYMKDQVQEAMSMYSNVNQPQQFAGYTQPANPYYGVKSASEADAAEANALYAQAYNQALFQKTASEAQDFVDTLFMNNYNQLLPSEAQNWSNLAQQNYNQAYKGY